uniref:Uncharacterized protein n=1 Tax=Arundo donax TaxID=35708 RepID=A0A0A9ENU8_ARUDO
MLEKRQGGEMERETKVQARIFWIWMSSRLSEFVMRDQDKSVIHASGQLVRMQRACSIVWYGGSIITWTHADGALQFPLMLLLGIL